MTIIEIAALENGAHRNQTGTFAAIPDGWAVIPEGADHPGHLPLRWDHRKQRRGIFHDCRDCA